MKYKTSMTRNTNGGQWVCLNIIKILRTYDACSFQTYPELLISILAIHGLVNHTLWVLGPCTGIMLAALCIYHHAAYECMHANDMLNIRAVPSWNVNTNEHICTPYMPAHTVPLIWCCSYANHASPRLWCGLYWRKMQGRCGCPWLVKTLRVSAPYRDVRCI